ncbi:MAG: conjugal transfer protein TraL, partial [Desulfobulbaceae bacterium]|nr:conjugal transfer protein TraL [Desulfobulbaceae bacterium]
MNLHLTLQGKGGVGKTLVTTLLAQYLLSKDITPLCVDTDPVNRSFTGFETLGVRPLNILENDKVDTRKFDELVDMIMEHESDCVVDNGAASFIPLTAYLKENNFLQFLSEKGITIYIHVVITSGQAFNDTIKGLEYIINTFGDVVNIVVWLNEYFGKIQYEGKDFEDLQIYKKNESSIYGLITIPEMTRETFGIDIKQMLEDR